MLWFVLLNPCAGGEQGFYGGSTIRSMGIFYNKRDDNTIDLDIFCCILMCGFITSIFVSGE